MDRTVKFAPNAGPVVADILKGGAAKVAGRQRAALPGAARLDRPGDRQAGRRPSRRPRRFPHFHVVLCKTPDDADAPDMPTVANDGKTMICQVGQKGQNVGVIGIFKGPKGTETVLPAGGHGRGVRDPADKEKGHPMLKLLQDYADTVGTTTTCPRWPSGRNCTPSRPCRSTEGRRTSATPSASSATRPSSTSGRRPSTPGPTTPWPRSPSTRPAGNFDGECIICHTVGYDFKTGYLNEKQTAHLKNVQCESCHGPASLHVDEEHGERRRSGAATRTSSPRRSARGR